MSTTNKGFCFSPCRAVSDGDGFNFVGFRQMFDCIDRLSLYDRGREWKYRFVVQ
jgi:hypothetical protein